MLQKTFLLDFTRSSSIKFGLNNETNVALFAFLFSYVSNISLENRNVIDEVCIGQWKCDHVLFNLKEKDYEPNVWHKVDFIRPLENIHYSQGAPVNLFINNTRLEARTKFSRFEVQLIAFSKNAKFNNYVPPDLINNVTSDFCTSVYLPSTNKFATNCRKYNINDTVIENEACLNFHREIDETSMNCIRILTEQEKDVAIRSFCKKYPYTFDCRCVNRFLYDDFYYSRISIPYKFRKYITDFTLYSYCNGYDTLKTTCDYFPR